MPLPKEIQQTVNDYCNACLPEDNWYENQLQFIEDSELRERIIQEFKGIRYAYKLFEGLGVQNENLMFEIRYQIIAYASIYEAIIQFVLDTYYYYTPAYNDMIYHVAPTKASIGVDIIIKNTNKTIVPYTMEKRRKKQTEIRFEEKCTTAEKLNLIHSFKSHDGSVVDFVSEIKEIYGYRNAVHLCAEKRKGINYDLELSKKAYRRMKVLVEQINDQLRKDNKSIYSDKDIS